VANAAGNQAEASGFYQKALALDAKNFDALNGLIGILKRQKQFDQARAQIERGMSSASKNDLPALHYLKADVFRAEKNYPAAESELSAAIELNNEYLPAYSAYAELLIEQNQIDRAAEKYRKILEKKESAAVYTLLGILEDSRGNFDESERNYRKALEIAPEASPIAANNLAWNIAAYNRGNLEEALQLAQTNVGRQSGNAGFRDTLGWIYYKKGLHAQAVEQLKKAIALDAVQSRGSKTPGVAGYRLRLGQVLAAAGDKSNARREVEVALQNQTDLSEKEVHDARNLLASL
jgi:tetratricopeptide (TPR) repeat protein